MPTATTRGSTIADATMKGYNMIRHHHWAIYGVFLGMSAGFVAAPGNWLQSAPTLMLAQTLTRELVQGHLNGSYRGMPLPVDFSLAEPGDIILCHNPEGAYGYWTHAVLYIGHGQVADANDFVRGTELRSVDHYRNYAEVMILRAKQGTSVREAAATWAVRAAGTPYDPLSTLADTRTEYCSKLIWVSYARVGLKLCPASSWVLPDHLAASHHVYCVGYWTAEQTGGIDSRVAR